MAFLTFFQLLLARFSRSQGGVGPDGRPPGGPRGEVVKRPSILKQDDLKELDELDHDGDEGWAGKRNAFRYSGTLEWKNVPSIFIALSILV